MGPADGGLRPTKRVPWGHEVKVGASTSAPFTPSAGTISQLSSCGLTVARDLNESVRESLGGMARPRMIVFVDRFGDELRGDDRRRVIAGLPLGDTPEPKHVTWAQIVAAAEHLP